MKALARAGFLASLAIAFPAQASIPPVGWQGPQWTGPGLLCAPGFTLRLGEGERAVQGYPSVGRIRYTVAGGDSAFEVADDYYSRTYEDGRQPVRTLEHGRLFLIPAQPEMAGPRYLFVPEERGLPFTVQFRSAGETRALEDVLSRLSFARPDRKGCLEQEQQADPATEQK